MKEEGKVRVHPFIPSPFDDIPKILSQAISPWGEPQPGEKGMKMPLRGSQRQAQLSLSTRELHWGRRMGVKAAKWHKTNAKMDTHLKGKARGG